MNYNKQNENGFTIIELIVVFSVITVLATFLILYNKINNAQIMLSLETAQLISLINKAKSLTMSTYLESGTSLCGYGINIDYNSNYYSLFRYGSSNECKNIASSNIDPNNPTYKEIEKIYLDKNIVFKKGNDYLRKVFFIPPDPKVLIWNNENNLPKLENDPDFESFIYLSTKDNSFEKKIILNIAGQISY